MKKIKLTLFDVSKENDTLFECDCCGKTLPANKMIWGIDDLGVQHCYGKQCYKRLIDTGKIY